MRGFLGVAATAAFVAGFAGSAMALSSESTSPAPQATDEAAPNGNANLLPPGGSSDQYPGVNDQGKHINVQAPYGGRNDAQADAKENAVTDQLNQQELTPGSTR